MVHPATTEVEERRVVFLTCCDLVCRSYPYINRIFFFNGGDDVESVVASLKEGLSKALVDFYPLSGRFCIGQEGRLQVECNNSRGADVHAAIEACVGVVDGVGGELCCGAVPSSAEFVEATCDLPFRMLAQERFQHHPVFWKLARRTHYLRCDYLHEPILSVQVTKFRDNGGISVGVSMSHAVADAQSFYDFVNCWGQRCRGLSLSVPPVHMRAALSVEALFPAEGFSTVSSTAVEGQYRKRHDSAVGTVVSKNLPSSEQELRKGSNEVHELTKDLDQVHIASRASLRSSGIDVKFPLPRSQAPIMEKQLEEEEHRRPRSDLVQKIFSFSQETLNRLKQTVNSEYAAQETCSNAMNDELNGGKAKSGFSFTTFESFCAHWWKCFIQARSPPADQCVFLLIPINCRRRFLDIPANYFGNALDGALVKMTAGKLCNANLSAIAGSIHEAIKAATEEGFKQYIREAEVKRNEIPHFDRTALFHIVDSPKYPIFDVDFGFGRPEAVRAEGFRFGAEVQIINGSLGAGSYDLFCALDKHTMSRLEHETCFLDL
ncbi:hypothetical protein KP509_15G008600 [Ceratopteris richardii]|nr:hypothetical protein KP509_15G008600 [Ceratopteris richardii]